MKQEEINIGIQDIFDLCTELIFQYEPTEGYNVVPEGAEQTDVAAYIDARFLRSGWLPCKRSGTRRTSLSDSFGSSMSLKYLSAPTRFPVWLTAGNGSIRISSILTPPLRSWNLPRKYTRTSAWGRAD